MREYMLILGTVIIFCNFPPTSRPIPPPPPPAPTRHEDTQLQTVKYTFKYFEDAFFFVMILCRYKKEVFKNKTCKHSQTKLTQKKKNLKHLVIILKHFNGKGRDTQGMLININLCEFFSRTFGE